MTTADLAAVSGIAAAVHVDYPEDAAVFAERLTMYPQGCYVLAETDGAGARIAGYLISHPWQFAQPPALNAMLGALPSPATTYYIHDIALLPVARGSGAAAAIVALLIRHAATIADNISLVAVGGTSPFWAAQRFARRADPALAAKLASYGGDACYMSRALADAPSATPR